MNATFLHVRPKGLGGAQLHGEDAVGKSHLDAIRIETGALVAELEIGSAFSTLACDVQILSRLAPTDKKESELIVIDGHIQFAGRHFNQL